jgi:hypothetical protein
MTRPKGQRRLTAAQVSERARAAGFFLAYHNMGPNRSLNGLAKYLAEAVPESKVSATTLKVYSVKYDWQHRLVDLDSAVAERMMEQHVQGVAGANTRQAGLGVALQALAMQGVTDKTGDDVSASEAARLAQVGVNIERLALGQATERREVVAQITNTLLTDIVTLFIRVNVMKDEAERYREFAQGADIIQEARVKEVMLALPEAPQGGQV